MFPALLLMNPPAPTYPEYAELLEQAKRTLPRFVDPANVHPDRPVIDRRGYDWCTAVLGFPYSGVERLSRVQSQLLIVADQADIDPPLPDWIVEGRAAGKRHQAMLDERRRAAVDLDRKAWAGALDLLRDGIELEVREGSRARTRGDLTECLRHAVPLKDVYSGTRKVRTHPAGRALCESETRARPLALGGVVDEPATCVRCLEWVPQVRATREAQ